MFSHSMCYLMPENNGQAGLVLGIGQQTLINHNLATRHTESIGTLVLHQVKLPGIVFQVVGKPILLQVTLHCSSQFFTHSLYHCSMLHIGRLLGCRHIFGIFLVGKAKHLLIRNRDAMCATREGHRLRCAA